MKRIILAAALLLSLAAGAQTRQERLTGHVYYLASDELQGRKAGTEFARMAADYIIGHYSQIGLKPFFGEWTVPFTKYGKEYTDVVGVIEGNDPELKDEYIVLGAHYDHLGVKNGNVYNGADDNASGSAALIEIARELYASRENLKRSVIIAAFDAEEIGLYGSSFLADTLSKTVGKDKIKLMMSIDMVGWYKTSGKLEMEGVATIRDGKNIISSEAERCSITVDPKRFEKSVFTATDTEGFAKLGVPTLAVSTGLKSPYHKPEDDAELIDYEGLDRVTGYISSLSGAIASDPSFEGSGRVARKHDSRRRFIEFGVVAGLQSNHIDFVKSSLLTKRSLGFDAGIQLDFNFGNFGIGTRALYEKQVSEFPDLTDAFASTGSYVQQAVTVPVLLMLKPGDSTADFRVGVGGYYSYVFDSNASQLALPAASLLSPLQVNPDQYGIAVQFGLKAGPLLLTYDFRRQLNKLFAGDGIPDARLLNYTFTLGYVF
ncbi:MAG: M28 family peptidase [Bacteroidales bacterium]|nr:M28 family peptidase [Bacteroidales bacterium]